MTKPAGRVSGTVAPLSTMTFELDGGQLWPMVAAWEAVSAAVADFARDRGRDAMRLGLPAREASLVAHGPFTTHTVHYPDRTEILGGRERRDVFAAVDVAVNVVHVGVDLFSVVDRVMGRVIVVVPARELFGALLLVMFGVSRLAVAEVDVGLPSSALDLAKFRAVWHVNGVLVDRRRSHAPTRTDGTRTPARPQITSPQVAGPQTRNGATR